MQLQNHYLAVFAALVFLSIGAHQYARRRAATAPSDLDTAVADTATRADGHAAPETALSAPPATVPDAEVWPDAWDDSPPPDPFALQRVRDEIARQMREYARTADPDCPHAMSEEEIEEFRLHGDPVVF